MDVIGRQHLRQMWDDLAEVYDKKTALIFESAQGKVRQFSYSELNEEINRAANLFHACGIKKATMLPYILITAQNFSFAGLDWQKLALLWCPLMPALCMKRVLGSLTIAKHTLW